MPMIDKIKKSIDRWKGKLWSMEERVTLFNSVLSANPAYYLSEKRSNSLKIPLKGISKKNVGYSLDPWDDVHQKKKKFTKKGVWWVQDHKSHRLQPSLIG